MIESPPKIIISETLQKNIFKFHIFQTIPKSLKAKV